MNKYFVRAYRKLYREINVIFKVIRAFFDLTRSSKIDEFVERKYFRKKIKINIYTLLYLFSANEVNRFSTISKLISLQ